MLYFKKNTSWLNFAFNFAAIYFVILIFISFVVKIVFDVVLDLNINPLGGMSYNDEKKLVPVKSYYDFYQYSKILMNVVSAILLAYFLNKRRNRMIAYKKSVEDTNKQNQKDTQNA